VMIREKPSGPEYRSWGNAFVKPKMRLTVPAEDFDSHHRSVNVR